MADTKQTAGPRYPGGIPTAVAPPPVPASTVPRVVPIIPPGRLLFGGGPGAALTEAQKAKLAEAAAVVRHALDKSTNNGHKKKADYTEFDTALGELSKAIDRLHEKPSDKDRREVVEAKLRDFLLVRPKDSEVKLTKEKDKGTGLTIMDAARQAISLTAPTSEVTREFEADALAGMLKKEQGDKLLKMWKDPNGRAQLEGLLKATTSGAGGPGSDLNDIARALVSLYDPAPTAPPKAQVMAWETERDQARDDVTEELQQIKDLFKRNPNSRLLSPMRRVAVASWWISQDPSDEGGHQDGLKNRIEELKKAIEASPGTETGFAYALLGFAGNIVERH